MQRLFNIVLLQQLAIVSIRTIFYDCKKKRTTVLVSQFFQRDFFKQSSVFNGWFSFYLPARLLALDNLCDLEIENGGGGFGSAKLCVLHVGAL